jgi:hypothetical protein
MIIVGADDLGDIIEEEQGNEDADAKGIQSPGEDDRAQETE